MGQEPDRRPPSVVRLAISVEGLTEEGFIKMVMVPHLEKGNIYAAPVILGSNSNGSKGGNVSLPRIKKELDSLARSVDKVTTMYDFYGFKGKGESDGKESLEQRIVNEVAEPLRSKIIPYIQMYEFEGLLFSSPEAIENNIRQTGLAKWAKDVLQKFNDNPEKINDSPDTAPSKRLDGNTDYKKTINGPNICKEIGLDVLRQKCTGFNSWLSRLEALR